MVLGTVDMLCTHSYSSLASSAQDNVQVGKWMWNREAGCWCRSPLPMIVSLDGSDETSWVVILINFCCLAGFIFPATSLHVAITFKTPSNYLNCTSGPYDFPTWPFLHWKKAVLPTIYKYLSCIQLGQFYSKNCWDMSMKMTSSPPRILIHMLRHTSSAYQLVCAQQELPGEFLGLFEIPMCRRTSVTFS